MNSSTKTEQELWKVIWDLEQRIKKLEEEDTSLKTNIKSLQVKDIVLK